jgi:hypothetical protein
MSKSLSLEQVHAFLKLNNCTLVSGEYKNNKSRLDVQCHKCKRIWNTSHSNLYNGNWCKYCRREVFCINKLKEIKLFVENNNHQLVSNKYKNKNTRIVVICNKCNYAWSTTYDALRKGYWCKFCSDRQITKKKSIKEAQSIAESRGGKCLDDKYINAHTKMLWQCKYGHTWRNTYGSIKTGYWCPKCSSGLYERICRKALEYLFEKEFCKIRPYWLKNKSGYNLELDGYCGELNIAFEHNGEHHYNNIKHYHRRQSYKEVIKNDYIKSQTCASLGIKLIIIPELENIVKLKDFKTYLIKEFERLNIKQPKRMQDFDINSLGIYTSKIDDVAKLAKNKNIQLLSKTYCGYKVKLLWQCSKGHEWRAMISDIKNNVLCPECNPCTRYTIDDIKEFAKKHNGKCLSDKYINLQCDLEWECEFGHRWFGKPSIQYKFFRCYQCKPKISKHTMDNVKKIAESYGGECLSSEYINNHVKMKWKCSKGHVWENTFKKVQAGYWCKACKGSKNED